MNAFVIDPNDSTHLFAGTDVGVYESTDSGTSWTPYGSGLPNAAVFDLAIGSPCTSNEVLRAATHGRGVWEVPISTSACGGGVDTTPPTASMIEPSKTLQFSKSFQLSWAGSDNLGGSGIKDYTVKVSKAPAKGTFSPYAPITALTNTTSTSVTLKRATGYTAFSLTRRWPPVPKWMTAPPWGTRKASPASTAPFRSRITMPIA